MSKIFFVSCLMALLISMASATADSISQRIVGGLATTINVAPYNVQLRRLNGRAFCGGAMISDRHVLTAAHCLPGLTASDLIVAAGTSYMSESGVQRRVERIFIHPEYQPSTMHSDAAVLKLSQPMAGPNISTVRMCSSSPRAGDSIQVTGWGSTSDHGDMSNQLRIVSFPITPYQSCVNEFHQFVQKNMFCGSGYEAKGHCFGDSGGPGLVRGELCGINSFGYKCGQPGHQSAFTDVFAVRQFILSAMRY